MKLVSASLMSTLMGLMLIGFIHNPNTLAMGLVLVTIGQVLMFTSGHMKGRKGHA